MGGYRWLEEFGSYRLESLERTGLVRPDQTRVASHIGSKDRSETASCSHSSGIPAFRRPAKRVVSSRARIFGNGGRIIYVRPRRRFISQFVSRIYYRIDGVIAGFWNID